MRKGSKHKPASRDKIKEARAKQVFTEEHKANLSKARRARGKFSKETRQKMSLANRKRFSNPEERRKVAEGNRGKEVGVDTRRKLSLANKGKKLSEEHRRKLSKALKGRKFTPEHLANLRAANQKKGCSAHKHVARGYLYAFMLPDFSGTMFGFTTDLEERAKQYWRGDKQHRAPNPHTFKRFDWTCEVNKPYDCEQEILESFELEGRREHDVVNAPLHEVIGRAFKVLKTR